MLYYEIEVYPQRVVVNEVDRLSMYHQKAWVDGQAWLYKIERSTMFPPEDKGWFGRGLNTVFWHAKNSGNHVTFEPVNQVKRRRAEKHHEKQLRLF